MSESEHETLEFYSQFIDAAGTLTVEEFLSASGRYLHSTPLAVDRIFLSLQTLHPAFRARTYEWEQGQTDVRITEWPHGLANRPGYYDSPDYYVHSSGQALRVADLADSDDRSCDLYGDLAARGYKDYLMLPLAFTDGTTNTLSIATNVSGGFPEGVLAIFHKTVDFFTIILERYTALETVNAALDTYLGRSAAREVLQGRIRSGYGEIIKAGVLFADINGFTGHSARLGPVETVRLVNDYFDCLVGPIEENGGYVLKFVGDEVMAFFPTLEDGTEPAPLAAIASIRARLSRMNEHRREAGQEPIHHALCMHFGEVVYGNIGSTERLDFTIIGETVNIAARGVEAAKELHTEYLFTEAFCRRFGQEALISLGVHSLRSVAEPQELFTVAPNSSNAGKSTAG